MIFTVSFDVNENEVILNLKPKEKYQQKRFSFENIQNRVIAVWFDACLIGEFPRELTRANKPIVLEQIKYF